MKEILEHVSNSKKVSMKKFKVACLNPITLNMLLQHLLFKYPVEISLNKIMLIIPWKTRRKKKIKRDPKFSTKFAEP